MRRRIRPAEEIPNRSWIMSLNDLLTLLLAFFILLVSLSSFNVMKIKMPPAPQTKFLTKLALKVQ